MKTIKNLEEVIKEDQFCIMIGNFDGVHSGHRNIIREVLKDCKKRKEKLLLLTFVPHPSVTLSNKKNFLINSYDERKELLEEEAVDYLLELDFTRDFSTQSPFFFLEKLIKFRKPKKFYLGYDFSFGANKSGGHETVNSFCKLLDIQVVLLEEFKDNNKKVNSSAVRELLNDGQIEKANDFLGRIFFIRGRIKKGYGRGRQIGFPTANLLFSDQRLIPPRGVYSTKVLYKNRTYRSITNIGFNPTFTDGKEINIETHILDFNKDIYGEEIEVLFFSYLRKEIRFESVEKLVEKINGDILNRKDLDD